MPEETQGEKILPASPRKKQRAREEGNVPRSQDLNAAWGLAVALLTMWILGPYMFRGMKNLTAYYFGSVSFLAVEPWSIQALAVQAMWRMAFIAGPFMILMLVAGIVANLVQVGFFVSGKALQPKLERIDPISGLQKFFSLRTFVELVKSVFKLAIVGAIVYVALRDRWEQMVTLMQFSPGGTILAVSKMVLAVWWRVVVAMIFLAILDYGYQRWQYERDLRMSRKEAQDEAKEMEGDPRIKQRVRQIQRQMATQRMMAEVPEAEVIITNPTRYAVALRYDEAEMSAPVVVAKGARLVAQRIREIGEEHHVPIVERPPLARTLYRSVEVGDTVPESLFRAVAEVLAYVYQIDRRAAKNRQREQALRTARETV